MSVQDDQTPPEPTQKPISMGGQVFLFALVRMIININTRMVYPFLNSFGSGLGVDLVTI